MSIWKHLRAWWRHTEYAEARPGDIDLSKIVINGILTVSPNAIPIGGIGDKRREFGEPLVDYEGENGRTLVITLAKGDPDPLGTAAFILEDYRQTGRDVPAKEPNAADRRRAHLMVHGPDPVPEGGIPEQPEMTDEQIAEISRELRDNWPQTLYPGEGEQPAAGDLVMDGAEIRRFNPHSRDDTLESLRGQSCSLGRLTVDVEETLLDSRTGESVSRVAAVRRETGHHMPGCFCEHPPEAGPLEEVHPARYDDSELIHKGATVYTSSDLKIFITGTPSDMDSELREHFIELFEKQAHGYLGFNSMLRVSDVDGKYIVDGTSRPTLHVKELYGKLISKLIGRVIERHVVGRDVTSKVNGFSLLAIELDPTHNVVVDAWEMPSFVPGNTPDLPIGVNVDKKPVSYGVLAIHLKGEVNQGKSVMAKAQTLWDAKLMELAAQEESRSEAVAEPDPDLVRPEPDDVPQA